MSSICLFGLAPWAKPLALTDSAQVVSSLLGAEGCSTLLISAHLAA